MRKVGTDKIEEYKIKGTDNKIIDMPVYYTHNLEKQQDYFNLREKKNTHLLA